MAEENTQAIEQQIADLQRQLELSRSQSGGDMSAPYERQEVHTAVGEQIRQQVPTYQASPSADAPAPAADVPGYQDPALVAQVQELVTVAFTHGVQEAISRAVKTGNSAIIDALHDVLTDELHDELIKRQKISAAV